MSQFSLLITAIGVSLLLSSVILAALIRPLRQVLAQLCRNGESTPFWVSFTAVMLYATPLFFAVMWTPIFQTSQVQSLRISIIAALFGAIGGLLIVGYKIASVRTS